LYIEYNLKEIIIILKRNRYTGYKNRWNQLFLNLWYRQSEPKKHSKNVDIKLFDISEFISSLEEILILDII